MKTRVPAAILALTAACGSARAQSLTYQQSGFPSRMEFLLPWSGPGAALFNPARIAQEGLFFVEAGYYGSLAGKRAMPFLQASVRPIFQLHLGVYGTWQGTKIDGSTAVYQESLVGSMLAVKVPMALPDLSLTLGAALPIRRYNAFQAVESSTMGLDLGGMLAWKAGHAGSLEAGLALHDLIPSEIKLPDDRGYYRAYELSSELSLVYSLPQGWADFNVVLIGRSQRDLSEGGRPYDGIGPDAFLLDVKSFGIEFRPVSWLGLKYEEPWDDHDIAWGLILRPRLVPGWTTELEFNFFHEKVLDPRPDIMIENPGDMGLGFVLAVAGRVGF